KVPSKNCPEYLRYRWAMQLANIRIASDSDDKLRELTRDERQTVHAAMVAAGHLGAKALKETVRGLPGVARDNLENLLLHPDAKDAFVFDPADKLISSHSRLSAVWPHLPE